MAANDHAIKPILPTPFPTTVRLWTCPKTGLQVPKKVEDNLAWRADLYAQAEEDEQLQADLYTASGKSLLFWANTFVFTYRVFETETDGEAMGRIKQSKFADIPYVSWAIQDRHLLDIEYAINNAESLLTDKTRDMGASWDHIIVFHHQFIFHRAMRPAEFLEISRVETDVDGAENPRCLFVKHDYINKWLPEWMRPSIKRTRLHIVNMDTGSRIDGESANKAAGSGDRKRAVLLDEMAKMENGTKIKASLQDVGGSLLPNSTPFGPGTAYSTWRNSGQIKVFVMPWWEHPEKGVGRYVKQDEATGKWKIRSPWYDLEEEKRSPREMAQEIDMDHIGSGDLYFESMVLEEHKRLFARKPLFTRSIDFRPEVAEAAIPAIIQRRDQATIKVRKSGNWKFWTKLIGNRPDQSFDYIFGIDVSQGQGASNSVCTVLCVQTGEVVAEFACANTPPHDFARIVCAAAVWFGGARHGNRPYLIWEQQGPGVVFGRQVVRIFQYPWYYKDRVVRTATEKQTLKYGWHSTREKKEMMLGTLRRGYALGTVIDHNELSLNEAMTYIYYAGGGIGPAFLIEESASARETHGDRVIGVGLAVYAREEVPGGKQKPPSAPARSFAGRRAIRRKQAKRGHMEVGAEFDWRNSGA